MKIPRRRRKLRLRRKKQRSSANVTSPTNTRTQSRALNRDASVGASNTQASNLSQTERGDAIQSLNREIEGAKNLPPAEASLLLRVAYFLRQVLLNLDSQDSHPLDILDQAANEAPADGTVRQEAADTADQSQGQAGDNATASDEGVLSMVAALQKKPADMTADEISESIIAVEKAIENGKLLLPADASLLQRLLYALKLILLELGGVDPELAVRDRDQLEALIAARSGDVPPDPATQAKVTKAIDDVNKAQADIASRNPVSQYPNRAEYSGLDVLKRKEPEDLSAQELADAIDDIDRSIEDSKMFPPKDASLLRRVLYALKMILFELGGVDPKLRYDRKEQLEALFAAKTGDTAIDSATKTNLTKALEDVSRAQAEIAIRGPASQNVGDSAYPGLDVLRRKKPEDLSTDEVEAALNDIERSIEANKVLLPENASLLLRVLYALKMALLDLGNVNPNLHYEIQEHLETILEARIAAGN